MSSVGKLVSPPSTIMASKILVFVLSCLTTNAAFALTNYNHNPNCLLMTAIAREIRVQDFSHLNLKYDLHLVASHQAGIVVKHLYSKNPGTLPMWKTCCVEIVIFYDHENIDGFYDDISPTWHFRLIVLTFGKHTIIKISFIFQFQSI